jgi:hypothetical protein
MTKKQIKRRNRKSNKKSRVNPITPLNFDECEDTNDKQTKKNQSNNLISKQNGDKPIVKTYESKTKNNKDKDKIKDNKKNQKTRKPPRRRPHDLLKLFEKGTINLNQYRAGERLILDYENSFRNICPLAFAGEVKIQKSNINNGASLIQNLYAWERYNKAMMSIDDLKTREVIRMFCIDGIGLSKIDRTLGRVGAAEVRLCYGLKDLMRYCRSLREE